MSNQQKSILHNLQKDASNKLYDVGLPPHIQSDEEIHNATIKLSDLADEELSRATVEEVKTLPVSRSLFSERNESLSDVSSSDINESSEDEQEVGNTIKRCHQVSTAVIVPDACALQYGFQHTLKLVDFQPISDSDISDQEGCSSIAKLKSKNYTHSKLKPSRCKTEPSSGDRKIQALLLNPETGCGKGKIITLDSIKSTIGSECKEHAGSKKAAQSILQNLKAKIDTSWRQKLEAGDDCSIHQKCQRTKQKIHINKDDQGAQDRSKTDGSNSYMMRQEMQNSNRTDIIHQNMNTSNVGPHQKYQGSQQKMKNHCLMKMKNPDGKQDTLVKPEANKVDVQSNYSSNNHPARDDRASKQLEVEVQHALTLTMKRWAEYLGKDNLKQEELKNALQYKYNDMALEMICASDTSVWGLLHDIGQCPCSHC